MSLFAASARACALALAMLMICAPAFARHEDDILVIAKRRNALTVPNKDEAKEMLDHVPGGTGFVDADSYRYGHANTIKDVLDYEPGVFAQPKFGEDTKLSIRGSGLSRNFHLRGVRLLQDGVIVNQTDGGGDFQEIDPLTFQYVELYKGANGLRYGAASLGGAINFVTPTGRDAPGLQLRAEGGSFVTGRGQLSGGGQMGGADGWGSVSYTHAEGYRIHSRQESLRFNANAGWRITPAIESRFYVTVNRIGQELPGSVSKAKALADPKAPAPINVANDYQRNIDSVRVQNKTAITLDEVLVEFGAYLNHRSLYHPIFQVVDYGTDDFGAFARAEGGGAVIGLPLEWTLGANWMHGIADGKRFVNVQGRRGALTADQDETAEQWELYGEARLHLVPSLDLIAGAQWMRAERALEDHFLGDGNLSAARAYESFNPRLGVLYEPGAGVQIFANLSRSAEPPPLSELAASTTIFSNLESQTAWTGEIGTRGKHGDVDWNFSLYRAHIRNELQFFQIAPNQFSAVNADKTIHQGAEIGFGWAFAHDLLLGGDKTALRLAYTFSDFVFDADPVWGNNKLPGAPRHYLRAELGYEHPSGFHIAPNIECVPKAYFADNANTLSTEPYVLLGIAADYQLTDHVRLFLDLRNLANKKYISSVSVIALPTPTNQIIFNPGDGRGVFAGLEVSL